MFPSGDPESPKWMSSGKITGKSLSGTGTEPQLLQLIIGIGAPSRSSTFINYTGIDNNLINFTMEIKGSEKIGFYMPGTLIPIVEENLKKLNRNDYLFLFSWHISMELIKKFKLKGFKGSFIIPLPHPKIVK